MPELAELRAMASLINSQSSTVYKKVLRNPEIGYGRSKVPPFAPAPSVSASASSSSSSPTAAGIPGGTPWGGGGPSIVAPGSGRGRGTGASRDQQSEQLQSFRISAEARGKELRILFHPQDMTSSGGSSSSNSGVSSNQIQASKNSKKSNKTKTTKKNIDPSVYSLIVQPGMSGHFVVGTMGMSPSALRRFVEAATEEATKMRSSKKNTNTTAATKKGAAKKKTGSAESDSASVDWNSLTPSELVSICHNVPAPFARAMFVPLNDEAADVTSDDTAASTAACPMHFVDPRKFAAWSPVVEGITAWDPRRGPDPVDEFDAFTAWIDAALGHAKLDKKEQKEMKTKIEQGLAPGKIPVGEMSIAELMLDQRFFNGVGNYVRAEVLYRARIDPRLTAISVLTTDHEAWLRQEGIISVATPDENENKALSKSKSTKKTKVANTKNATKKASSTSGDLSTVSSMASAGSTTSNLSHRGRRLLLEVKNVLTEAIERKFSFGAESAQWQRRAAEDVARLMAKDVSTPSSDDVIFMKTTKKRSREDSADEAASDHKDDDDAAASNTKKSKKVVGKSATPKELQREKSDPADVIDIAGDEGFDSWLNVYGQKDRPGVCQYSVAGRTVWYHPGHQCTTPESAVFEKDQTTAEKKKIRSLLTVVKNKIKQALVNGKGAKKDKDTKTPAKKSATKVTVRVQKQTSKSRSQIATR